MGREQEAPRAEVLRDGTIHCEEPLGLAGGLKPLHAPFPLPRRLMGVFRPVVQIAMLPMFNAGQDLALGGPVASQLIRDDYSMDVS